MTRRIDRMTTEGFSDGGREEDLLRHAGDIIVEIRPDARFSYVSSAAKPLLGRSPSYFVDRSFLEILVPEDRLATLARFRKVVETDDEPIIRFRCTHRDGHRVQFEASLRGFIDDRGRKRVVAVCRDLTEQTQQRAADHSRLAYHRVIAESSTRPAAVATLDGEMQYSSRRFREIFGNCSNIREIQARMSEESRIAMDTSWYRAAENEDDRAGSADFEYRLEDGSTAWFSAAWEAVLPERGQRRFAMTFQDITRRKKIEAALRTIAQGIPGTGQTVFRPIIAMMAAALDVDRIVVGLLSESRRDELDVLVAWQDGAFLEIETLDLDGLPDHDVANGEVCIHPTALVQLMPTVGGRLGHDFESYAGLPLHRADGRVIGIVGGYARQPIHDTDLIRSLLSSFATSAAAAIGRQQADEEIQSNRARFDALALQSHDMLIEVDGDARITHMSPASISVLGRAPESMIGTSVEEYVHPDDLELLRATYTVHPNDPERRAITTRALHTDGSWRWLESTTSFVKAIDGSPRTLVVARDVSERQRGELGRDLLYSVVQHGADLVFICEPDSTLLFANEAAMRLLRTPEEPEEEAVEGIRFGQLLTDPDAARLESEILPRVARAEQWSGELALRGSIDSDDPVAAEATIYLFQGTEDPEVTYLAITLRDISQRRNAEAALRESELRLSQAQKMEAVGRLAGGIAHDFNNLLTAIIGYSDLVHDQLGDGHGAARDVEEILRAAERAGGLTRQLLAFSRRQVLQPESVDLNAVVADIDRMMRRLIGENIELVTVQDGGIPRIIADPGQIEQVIVNLVVNARDAMPMGGRLEVETARYSTAEPVATASGTLAAGDYVLLKVSDSGIGMDEGTRRLIFEPFFTTKEAHEGTGLGLASAYGVVSQSGGQIEVESAPDQGTCFSIYLPAATLDAQVIEAETEAAEAGGSETILVVEDSDPVRTLVARSLEKAGYTVLSAESATAALRHCSRHAGPIDLLLSDVVLPKASGPEVARRAIELRPSMRVLFMSGFTDDTLIRHGLRPGRSTLLEKPFAPAAVRARVRALLDADPPPSAEMFPVEHPE